jgi:hypothetical protein
MIEGHLLGARRLAVCGLFAASFASFPLIAKLNKLTIKVDRPQLSP